ncbi:hypothetical protein TNCV_4343721 [Trichonephila clavipes]|nr:hypothetical protein TNCV_4343721 [Trichonephila clavipes]
MEVPGSAFNSHILLGRQYVEGATSGRKRSNKIVFKDQKFLKRIVSKKVVDKAVIIQDALFICYKQSPDNVRSVAFSQRAKSPRSIEDETLNDWYIFNNLIDYM